MDGLGFLVKARGRSHLVPRKVTVKKPGGGTYQAIRYVRTSAAEAKGGRRKTSAEKPSSLQKWEKELKSEKSQAKIKEYRSEIAEYLRDNPDASNSDIKKEFGKVQHRPSTLAGAEPRTGEAARAEHFDDALFTAALIRTRKGEKPEGEKPEAEKAGRNNKYIRELRDRILEKVSLKDALSGEHGALSSATVKFLKDPDTSLPRYLASDKGVVAGQLETVLEAVGGEKPEAEGTGAKKPDKVDFSDLPKHATDFTDEHIGRIFDFYVSRPKKKLKEHREVLGDQLETARDKGDRQTIADLEIKHEIVSNAIIELDNPGRGREGLPEGKATEDEKVEKAVTVIPLARACGAAGPTKRGKRRKKKKGKK